MGRGPTEKYYIEMNDDYVEGSLTCLKQEVIEREINTDFPLVLNIEPTNDCNLRCTFCPRDQTVAMQGTHYLPLATFQRIVDEAVDYQQLIMLNLHKDGESLLHRELPEMIDYAKKRNVAKTVHMNTNGTLLHTDTAKAILTAGIDDVTVSIDAATAGTYRTLKQSRGFDHLDRSVESFIDYRNKIGGHTTIRVKIMEFDQVSEEEIEAFRTRWTGVADQVQVTGVHTWSGAITDLEITDETSPTRYPCAILWYALAVNCNGKVSICNLDWNYSGVVGDLAQQSLHQIWNGLPMRKIRQAHLDGDWGCVSACKECVVWVSVGDMLPHLRARNEFLPVARIENEKLSLVQG